jgi:ATP-dependent DNA ligase
MERCLSRGVAIAMLAALARLAVPPGTLPMEARQVETLPYDSGWQFEPKWDGFRCLAFRHDDTVELRSKSGKTLTRYFPDIAAELLATPVKRFVLDGELAIPVNGILSFEALQLRLHPAESRVRKLAAETPAILILFDTLLTLKNRSLIKAFLAERRPALEELFAKVGGSTALRLSPYTRSVVDARRWLANAGGSLDGVIAKRVDEPYRPGERAMLKVKCLRTADCVVGGFRYAEKEHRVGSLLLGLYNEQGELDHVGFTSGFADIDRDKLTRQLEALRKPPGFTGKAPGGPSRWSTERSGEWEPLATKLVAEVRYDHVSEDRFRHGTKFLRWRPDKAPSQCTYDQLRRERPPAQPIAAMLPSSSE